MSDVYVHGYEPRENERLADQAGTLVDLLHADTAYPPGSTVLEAGCGVGAQTITLAQRSPQAHFTSVDISATSVVEAERRAGNAGITNVRFGRGDILNLPFKRKSFDHVFVCFVLEHLARPVEALTALATLLRPGGTITVIEGDHGSAYFHPDSPAAQAAIGCQIELQARAGGNALIGRQVYPLLVAAGFKTVKVSPRMVYVDASQPELIDGFTTKTFTAMIEGVREPALAAGLIDASSFDAGIGALRRTTEVDGVFCYTFFKGVGCCEVPAAGAEIAVASPNGGPPPLDPMSDEPDYQTDQAERFKADETANEVLANTVRLDSVAADDFDGVFYPGGHGPLWDLANDENSAHLIENTLRAGKPVALVCHAPGVLRHVTNEDGTPLVHGKKVTGFAATEEEAVELTDVVPSSSRTCSYSRAASTAKALTSSPTSCRTAC